MGANKHQLTGAEKQMAKQQKLVAVTCKAITKAVQLNRGKVICASRAPETRAKAIKLLEDTPAMPKPAAIDASLFQSMEHLHALMEVPVMPRTTVVVFACQRTEVSQMQLDMLQTFMPGRHFFLPV